MKLCLRCRIEKSETSFSRNRAKRDGLQGTCKECWKTHRNTPEAIAYHKAYMEKYVTTESGKAAQHRRMLRKRPGERVRGLKKYNLSVEDFEQMLKEQQGVCKICGTDRPGHRGTFHVDHCHQTGVVRGLLCMNCNIGIGHLQHEPRILQAAIDYVRSITRI